MHIESCNDPAVAAWLQEHLHILPVAPRPDGYSPLGRRNLDSRWIARLGRSGRDCYDAILRRDLAGFGRSMNECMFCWQTILPDTVDHTTLTVDLAGLLKSYQSRYPGAMYSGCGGGYLLVASDQPVPGSFQIQVRIQKP